MSKQTFVDIADSQKLLLHKILDSQAHKKKRPSGLLVMKVIQTTHRSIKKKQNGKIYGIEGEKTV